MTYDQYQQLYGAAKEQIAARVAKIQPTAGNGASVNGMGIAIEVPAAEQQVEERSWNLLLFGSISDNVNNFNTGVELAGTLVVDEQLGYFLLPNDSFWEATSVYDIPAGANPRQYKAANIRFWARAIDRGTNVPPNPPQSYGRRLFDASYYRVPVKLTLEQYDAGIGDPYKVVAEHTLQLRREGQEQLFRPIGSPSFQQLAFKSLELL